MKSAIATHNSELRLRPDGDLEYYIDDKLRVLLWRNTDGWRVGFPAQELFDGGFGHPRNLDQAIIDAISYLITDIRWDFVREAKQWGLFDTK